MVGQHIRVLKSGRWVHAVDCGDETVLHLAADAPPPRVRRAYRPEFVAGAEAVEVVTHRERTFPPKEIVKRAYSRASDPALASMFADSESFVEWCTTGRLSAARNFAVDVPGLAPAEAAGPAPRVAVAKAAPQPKAKGGPRVKAKAPASVKPRAAVKAKAGKPAPRVKANPAAGKRKGAKPASRVTARGAVARKPAAKMKGAVKSAGRARVKAGRGGNAGSPARAGVKKAGVKARRGRR